MKNRKYIVLLIVTFNLFSCSMLSNQQNKASIALSANSIKINSILDSLIQTGIDTILIYNAGCIGCVEEQYNPHYIFWVEEKEINIFKLDNYSIYEKELLSSNLFDYFFANQNEIEQETAYENSNSFLHYHFIVFLYSSKRQR